jgi:cell wall-associated NlpC family hydrolase
VPARRPANGSLPASLLDRLLRDADFRARFRADPRAALESVGLGRLAEQLAAAGDPMQTLQPRESRSSLAGAAIAAAVEGAVLLEPWGQFVDAAHAATPPSQAGGHGPADALDSKSAAADARPSSQHQQAGAQPSALAADDQSDNGDDGSDSGDGGDGGDPTGDDSDSGGDDGGDGGDPTGDDSDSGGDDGGDGGDPTGDDSDSGGDDGGSDDEPDELDSAQSGGGGGGGGGGAVSLPDVLPSTYPGDDAPRPEIAAWMAQEARSRGIPPELPVMAALTESGLRDLDYGDRDSVGFFQMRLSVWNHGPYAGFSSDPKRQLDWFLDQAQAVAKQRVERGQSITDPKQYGDWVADIERPAAQYRGRYQPNLGEARQLLAQYHGRGHGANELVDAVDAGAPRPGPQALMAVAAARKELGVPYQWGGASPSTGFDCSGLVQWAYAQVGIRLPRVSEDQINAPGGTPVGRHDLLPGDLVFFKNASGDVHHVGISLGGDRFIEAPHTGDVIKVASLNEPYFAQEFDGGRRFVPAGAPGPSVDPQLIAARAKAKAIDARAVKLALAALENDQREVHRHGSALSLALARQERGKGNAAMFLPAVSDG